MFAVLPPSSLGLLYSPSGVPNMITPSPMVTSAWVIRPSSPVRRIFSVKPNALARNSSAASESSYSRYGITRGYPCGGFCAMTRPPFWSLAPQLPRAGRKGQPLGQSQRGQREHAVLRGGERDDPRSVGRDDPRRADNAVARLVPDCEAELL